MNQSGEQSIVVLPYRLLIRLQHSGVIITRDSLKNPICVVANYLFDTLCHDIFQVA